MNGWVVCLKQPSDQAPVMLGALRWPWPWPWLGQGCLRLSQPRMRCSRDTGWTFPRPAGGDQPSATATSGCKGYLKWLINPRPPAAAPYRLMRVTEAILRVHTIVIVGPVRSTFFLSGLNLYQLSIIQAKLTPTLTSSEKRSTPAAKQINSALSAGGRYLLGEDEQMLTATPWDLISKISLDHKEQICLAHVRHCRLVTNTHPMLSRFADSPHFISRDRVPVAIARRWQFTNLNRAVSEACEGLTPIHHLMQMKRPVCCKDDLTR